MSIQLKGGIKDDLINQYNIRKEKNFIYLGTFKNISFDFLQNCIIISDGDPFISRKRILIHISWT